MHILMELHENAPLAFHGLVALIGIAHLEDHWDRRSSPSPSHDVRNWWERRCPRLHKQMLLALSSQRIPRIDRVLRVGFKEWCWHSLNA